jgi:hypothetical protein
MCLKFDLNYDENFTDQTTHVVTYYRDKFPTKSVKLLMGIAARCYIVTVAWVDACLSANRILSEVSPLQEKMFKLFDQIRFYLQTWRVST